MGGGPAGVLLATMLASQGLAVVVLESQKDFDRDFRGDTLQPSALEILDDLGLLDLVLTLPHLKRSGAFSLGTTGDAVSIDSGTLATRFPYSLTVSQARLLPLLVEHARRFSSFRLELGARVTALVTEGEVVKGVTYVQAGAEHTLRAPLTIGADGRFSKVRELAGLTVESSSSPMDILWFRLPRAPDDPVELSGPNAPQRMLLTINRHDHWQLGYIFPKDGIRDVKARGLPALREEIATLRPALASALEALQSWKDTAVLSVQINRARTWHRDGLLLIGDAAHAMAPIGSVGISYAIQDAVCAAEVLVPRLKAGAVTRSDLARVQRLRERPTRLMQAFQALAQRKLFEGTSAPGGGPARALRWLPFLPRVLSWFIQLGPWRTRVVSLKSKRAA